MIQWLSRILMLISLSLLVTQAAAKTTSYSMESIQCYPVEVKNDQVNLDQESPATHFMKWIASEETENEDGDPDEQQADLLATPSSGNIRIQTHVITSTPAFYSGRYVLDNQLRPIFLIFQNFRL